MVPPLIGQVAQPTPAVVQPPAPEVRRAAPPARNEEARASYKLAAGASYTRYFAVPMYGGELSFGVGNVYRRLSSYFGLHAELGRSRAGLSFSGLTFAWWPELSLGPVRLGLGPRLGFLWVRAPTASSLSTAYIGVGAQTSVDLWRPSEPEALYVAASFTADYLGEGPRWGPRFVLGYRWGEPVRH